MDDYRFGRPRPSEPFETYAWLFMRISGVLLVLLALGHLAQMHLVIGVDNLSYRVVAERFSTPFWRLYDLAMLVLALLHGFNGLRVLVDDYIKRDILRAFALSFFGILGSLLLVVGAYILITFQPIP